jgi:hypothetical protein
MIELFGPTYRFNGEVLTDPEIIYVNDHHYDEENQCFHLRKLLENSVCDPQQHLLVFDHINHEDELNEYNHICLPIFLAGEVQEFINQKIQPDWSQKSKIFNFMINKPRLNREFLLIMIEHFGLDNYSHSLAWKKINFNKITLKARMQNPLYRSMVDQATEIIPVTNYVFGPEVALDQGVKNGNFKNEEAKQLLIRKATGYISFVRGDNPYTFPFKAYPSIFSSENTFSDELIPYPTLQMNGKPIANDGIKTVDVFLTQIGSYQSIAYSFIIDDFMYNAKP